MQAGSDPLGLTDRGWRIVGQVRNPWGEVPLTAGGASLHGRAREYMDELLAQQDAPNPVSRRHHYVPQAYLRQWSSDGRRVWVLDTVTGAVKLLGVRHVCVKEHFHTVIGPDGAAHNRVELMFGVVDTELRRVQILFDQLDDPETLEFDDLVGLGVSMAVQRMRTMQQRRLRRQHNAWLIAQNPGEFASVENDVANPYRESSFHTQLLFQAMWKAADVLTTRQIEVWHDPKGRFMTCDAPVLVPFRNNIRPDLVSAPHIIWPVSPHRVVALSNDLQGEKAIIRPATGKFVGVARDAVMQGRERMIVASDDQFDRLPAGNAFRRRTQLRLRCSDRGPDGEYMPPPSCCVHSCDAFAAEPDVVLCDRGLHSPAPDMALYA